jgi:hypothetical protein
MGEKAIRIIVQDLIPNQPLAEAYRIFWGFKY